MQITGFGTVTLALPQGRHGIVQHLIDDPAGEFLGALALFLRRAGPGRAPSRPRGRPGGSSRGPLTATPAPVAGPRSQPPGMVVAPRRVQDDLPGIIELQNELLRVANGVDACGSAMSIKNTGR